MRKPNKKYKKYLVLIKIPYKFSIINKKGMIQNENKRKAY